MPRFIDNTDYRTFALLAATVLLAGCESTPTALERNFGSSVRNMIELQTAPPGYQGFGMDGRKGEAVLENYRKDVAETKKVEQSTLRIQVGK
jgi:starvation-inducible outer membrane lipoprotein